MSSSSLADTPVYVPVLTVLPESIARQAWFTWLVSQDDPVLAGDPIAVFHVTQDMPHGGLDHDPKNPRGNEFKLLAPESGIIASLTPPECVYYRDRDRNPNGFISYSSDVSAHLQLNPKESYSLAVIKTYRNRIRNEQSNIARLYESFISRAEIDQKLFKDLLNVGQFRFFDKVLLVVGTVIFVASVLADMYFVKQGWFFLGLAIYGIPWIVRYKRDRDAGDKIHPNVILGVYEGAEIYVYSYKDSGIQESISFYDNLIQELRRCEIKAQEYYGNMRSQYYRAVPMHVHMPEGIRAKYWP